MTWERLKRGWSGLLGGESSGEPSTELDRHNGRLLRLEAPFMALAFSGAPSFFALFAIQLGASNSLVGWLTAGPALLNLFWLLPAGRLLQRHGYAVGPLALTALGQRLTLLLMALVPFLPADWRPWGVVVVVTLAAIPSSTWGVAVDSSFSELVSPRHMARILGQRWAVGNLANVFGVYLLGRWIDLMRFPLNFQFLFAGCGLIGMATLALITQLRFREPDKTDVAAGPADVEAPLSWHSLRGPYLPFLLLEISALFAYISFYGANPVLRIYWVRDLAAAGSGVGAFTAAYWAGSMLGNLVWGQASRPNRDRRFNLLAALGGLMLYPLGNAAAGGQLPLLAAGALGGFCVAGNDLMMFKRLLQVAPRRQRAHFISIHSMILYGAAFVSPLASAELTDLGGARLTLVVLGGIGLLAAGLLYFAAWRSGPKLPIAEGERV